jgi:hypothetical protein
MNRNPKGKGGAAVCFSVCIVTVARITVEDMTNALFRNWG